MMLLLMMMMMMRSCIKRPPSRVAALVLSPRMSSQSAALAPLQTAQLPNHTHMQRCALKPISCARSINAIPNKSSNSKPKSRLNNIYILQKLLQPGVNSSALWQAPPPSQPSHHCPKYHHTSAARHKRLPLASSVTLLVDRCFDREGKRRRHA